MIHREYEAVFGALREANISFCVLRNEIDGGIVADDLDLLVQSSAFDAAVEALGLIGYCVRVTRRLLPYKSVLVAFKGGRFFVIDLHQTVVQDGIVLLDGDKVLQRMPESEGVYLPADADMLVILLLHNIIGKARIQDKHAASIRDLASVVSDAEIRQVLANQRIADRLCAVLQKLSKFEKDDQLVRTERQRLLDLYRSVGRDRLRHKLRTRIFRFLTKYSLRTRAPLYALTGVDGAGKSSLQRELSAALSQPGGFRVYEIYMGPWGHYLLGAMHGELFVPGWSLSTRDWLARIFQRPSRTMPPLHTVLGITLKLAVGRELSDSEQQSYAVFRDSSRLFVTLRYVRSVVAAHRFLIMLTIEMYYRYYLVYRKRRRGVVVIADRYIYDLMTGRMHEMIPQYRRVRSFLCRVFPRPTRVYLLQNDPDTILARKRDLTRTALVKHQQLYEELANDYGFTRIRTDRPAKELANEIVTHCFEEIIGTVRV